MTAITPTGALRGLGTTTAPSRRRPGALAGRQLPTAAGKYILLTLFLAVTLEAFEAKYDPNAARAGPKAGLSGMFSSMRSGLSSLRSQLSSIRSGTSSKAGSRVGSEDGRGGKGKAGGKVGAKDEGGEAGSLQIKAHRPGGSGQAGSSGVGTTLEGYAAADGGGIAPGGELVAKSGLPMGVGERGGAAPPACLHSSKEHMHRGHVPLRSSGCSLCLCCAALRCLADVHALLLPPALPALSGYSANAGTVPVVATAAPSAEPKVVFSKMYTIKNWIESGNIGAINKPDSDDDDPLHLLRQQREQQQGGAGGGGGGEGHQPPQTQTSQMSLPSRAPSRAFSSTLASSKKAQGGTGPSRNVSANKRHLGGGAGGGPVAEGRGRAPAAGAASGGPHDDTDDVDDGEYWTPSGAGGGASSSGGAATARQLSSRAAALHVGAPSEAPGSRAAGRAASGRRAQQRACAACAGEGGAALGEGSEVAEGRLPAHAAPDAVLPPRPPAGPPPKKGSGGSEARSGRHSFSPNLQSLLPGAGGGGEDAADDDLFPGQPGPLAGGDAGGGRPPAWRGSGVQSSSPHHAAGVVGGDAALVLASMLGRGGRLGGRSSLELDVRPATAAGVLQQHLQAHSPTASPSRRSSSIERPQGARGGRSSLFGMMTPEPAATAVPQVEVATSQPPASVADGPVAGPVRTAPPSSVQALLRSAASFDAGGSGHGGDTDGDDFLTGLIDPARAAAAAGTASPAVPQLQLQLLQQPWTVAAPLPPKPPAAPGSATALPPGLQRKGQQERQGAPGTLQRKGGSGSSSSSSGAAASSSALSQPAATQGPGAGALSEPLPASMAAPGSQVAPGLAAPDGGPAPATAPVDDDDDEGLNAMLLQLAADLASAKSAPQAHQAAGQGLGPMPAHEPSGYYSGRMLLVEPSGVHGGPVGVGPASETSTAAQTPRTGRGTWQQPWPLLQPTAAKEENGEAVAAPRGSVGQRPVPALPLAAAGLLPGRPSNAAAPPGTGAAADGSVPGPKLLGGLDVAAAGDGSGQPQQQQQQGAVQAEPSTAAEPGRDAEGVGRALSASAATTPHGAGAGSMFGEQFDGNDKAGGAFGSVAAGALAMVTALGDGTKGGPDDKRGSPRTMVRAEEQGGGGGAEAAGGKKE